MARRSPFVVAAFLALSVTAACSGGSSSPPSTPQTATPTQGATATPTPMITPTPLPGHTSTPTPVAATPTPQPGHTSTPTPIPTTGPSAAPTGSSALVDWPTYGFDVARDGFNPNTAAFTPTSLGNLHQVWNTSLVAGAQSQPVVVTGVPNHAALLIFGTGDGHEEALDGMTGAEVWTTSIPVQNDGVCGTSGVAGTALYVSSLGAIFITAGNGGGTPNHDILYELNVATGDIMNHTDLSTNLLTGESTSVHSAVTYANGLLYIGTSSNCVAASWRGSVIAVNPATLQPVDTFYLTWQQGGPYSGGNGNYGGGSVWGWGGVSADPAGNIYVGGGNGMTQDTYLQGTTVNPPFVAGPDQVGESYGYAEHIAELNSSLQTVIGAYAPALNFSVGYKDLDETGTPVVFQPSGCDQLVASQGKGGKLDVVDTTNWSAAVGDFTFSEPNALGNYMGNPGFSPLTGLLYAPITSAVDASYQPGLAAIGNCGSQVMWHAQFGPDSFGYSSSGATPRSAPVATDGGVVFAGTPCTQSGSTCGSPSGSPQGAVWAVDASAGTVLNGGNPVLFTMDTLRMAPTVDGQWMWVCDQSGNVYALTVNPSITAKVRKAGVKRLPLFHYRSN